MSRALRFAVVAVATASVALPASAAYVPVFGGPTYDPATGNGYVGSTAQVYIRTSGIRAYDGLAIGTAYKQVNGSIIGSQAMVWGVGGVVDLQTLGQAANGALRGGADVLLPNNGFAGTSEKFVNGQSVGNRPVRWTSTGQVSEMAYPGESGPLADVYLTGSSANGVTFGVYRLNVVTDPNGGQATVYSRPARWSIDGTTVTDLGVLGTDANGNTNGAVAAVNQAGTATGSVTKYVDQTSTGFRAVRWDATSDTATELPQPIVQATPATDYFSNAINETGTIVGTAAFYGTLNSRAAIRWDAGSDTATVLDGITTAIDGKYGYNQAYDVNDSGTAIGIASATYSTGASVRAARWDAGTAAITVLGLLGNPVSTVNAYAFDINDAGLTVGMQRVGNQGGGTAILWGLDGMAVDLNSFIDPASNWTLVEADSISETNWVAGTGLYDPDGAGALAAYYRPFLIQVPEPTMIGLAAMAAGGLLRRRRGM